MGHLPFIYCRRRLKILYDWLIIDGINWSLCTVLWYSLYLQHEIEELRAHVLEGTNRQMQMESDYSNSQRCAELDNSKLTEELTRLRDRYDR